MICEVLREKGFAVVEAGSADEAMSYIATGQPVDIVFSDVRMPGSMDGIALGQRLRADHPDMKIMLTSGDHGAQAMTSGLAFFAKPYNPYHIAAVMTAKLTEREP